MFLYEYKCECCGNSFETRNTVDQRDSAVCDMCGNGASRVFSLPQISIPCGFKTDKFRYNTYETAKVIDDRNEMDSTRYPNSRSSPGSNRTFEETFRDEYKRFK